MRKYLRNNLRALSILCGLLLVAVACTKVDNGVGDDFIPDRDKLEMKLDTLSGFQVATVTVDSVRVDEESNASLGSYVSSRVGRITAGYLTEVLHSTVDKDTLFGEGPILDSVCLLLNVQSYIGSETMPITVSLYELNKNFRKPTNVYRKDQVESDTIYNRPYYSNLKIEDYIPATPMATFSFSMRKILDNANNLQVRIPDELGKRVLEAPKEVYAMDSLFRKMFKGFYLKPEPVFSLGTLFSIAPANSAIQIFYHTKKSKELRSVLLDFTHFYEGTLYSQMVITIKNDYTFSLPQVGIDPRVVNNKQQVFDYSYVSGFAGVMTKLKFPVEKIQQLKKQLEDTPSAAILVTNATLILPVKNTDILALDEAMSGLGAYYEYTKPTYMPGYNDEQGESIFGGLLNRSKNVYEMNVTKFVQQLLNNKTDRTELDIAPSITQLFSTKGVCINNSSSNPIRLAITYSVSK